MVAVDVRLVAQALVSGILNGGVYGIVALGLALIFGVMRIINFAHGAFMMLAMYLSYWAFVLAGVDPYLSVVLTVPALFVMGLVVQRYLINHVLAAPEHAQLLLTLGIALVVQNAALALWSPDPRSISVPYTSAVWYVGEVAVGIPRLVAFGAAIVAALLLFLMLTRTDLGKAMRAAAEEAEGARLVGIDVAHIYAVAFGLGLACVAVAGTVVLPYFRVEPHVGDVFVLIAFVTVVLGGMGNLVGALLGGLIIGVAESLGALLPGSLKHLVVFTIFVVVLLFRPQGLLGARR